MTEYTVTVMSSPYVNRTILPAGMAPDEPQIDALISQRTETVERSHPDLKFTHRFVSASIERKMLSDIETGERYSVHVLTLTWIANPTTKG